MLCPCFKNRSYALFRASMKRLPKMKTIVEEVYVTVKEPGPEWYCEESAWIEIWQDAHWGQWADIEYDYIDVCYEPRTTPPAIR